MDGSDSTTVLRQGVKESIKKLEDCVLHLSSKIQNVNSVINSVKTSSMNATKVVENHFDSAKKEINLALETRKALLLTTIKEIETSDLEPLTSLKQQLDGDLASLKNLIDEGHNVLEQEDDLVIKNEKEIRKKLQPLKNSYSELPCAAQNLLVSVEDSEVKNIVESVQRLGEVQMLGSLQIVELVEQAGGILVQWDETLMESESFTESSVGTQEYMLQYCEADNKVSSDDVFNTIYQGEQMSYLVTDIEPHVTYIFRVCGRSSNKEKWGPWSACKNGVTSLEPHEWSLKDCKNEKKIAIYQLSNDRRTATKVFPESSRVLRSRSMSYILGNSITFTIEETGEPSASDIIGLITQYCVIDNKQVLQGPECVGVNSKGIINVNGTNMTTRLPPFKRGTQISFEACKLSGRKLRVSVGVDNKEVTLDWALQNEVEKLYFAMCFGQSGWQVTIDS